MRDRWVLKSKINWLNIPKYNLCFRNIGAEVEICSFTNKTIDELEDDRDIKIHIAHGNLYEIEKQRGTDVVIDDELSKKLDKLIKIMGENKPQIKTNDIDSIVDILSSKISDMIDEKLSNIGSTEKKSISKTNDDDDMEEIRRDLIKESIKHSFNSSKVKDIGMTKKVENEADGFDLDI